MSMINCYMSWILLSVGWYPTTSKPTVTVCNKRTLDGCLQTISSLIGDNDNLIYRIKDMCSDSGQQATRCAIRELVNCPDYLSKPTGHDMQLHFLEEITVQDQTDACFVWSGIPDDVKDKLNRAYTEKWTEVCVQMKSYQITPEPDGSRDICGYMNLNDRCALKTIHEQFPQYEKSFYVVMNASLVFSSCTEHKHGHDAHYLLVTTVSLEVQTTVTNGTVWYRTTSVVAVAVCQKRTLDGCLQTISSLIEDDDNLVYRISVMCSDSGQQATSCAIRELVNCPDYLSKPTGHDMQLHFLEEITVKDQTDACVVWSGIPDNIKETLRQVYNSKMTEICVMMMSSQITQEPDGSFDTCGYINLRDKCVLQTIHDQYPQYEKDSKAVMNASLVFSSCVEHKHGHNGSVGTTSFISLHCILIELLVFILCK